ncbi:hypothetical protein CT19431_240088 [Cupriavidus taiwanensis]|nr:hypothetical protein CT19431_240088 [Cupriavidus taiwanensis]
MIPRHSTTKEKLRLTLITFGIRGDCRPMAALPLDLASAGFWAGRAHNSPFAFRSHYAGPSRC